MNKKKIFNEFVDNLKSTLIKEEGEGGLLAQDRDYQISTAIDAQTKADGFYAKMPSSQRIKADDSIKQILSRGSSVGIDYSFIKDLYTRYSDGEEREVGNTEDTDALDYITQKLVEAIYLPEGQPLDLGTDEIQLTSGMKKNAKDGLQAIFRPDDKDDRYFNFLLGSNRYSQVPQSFRPKVKMNKDGTMNVSQLRDTAETAYFQLLNNFDKVLGHAVQSTGKISSYILTAMRNYMKMLIRSEKAASYNTSGSEDNEGFGFKQDLQGKGDNTYDIRSLASDDQGSDNMSTGIKHFIRSIADNIDTSLGSMSDDQFRLKIGETLMKELSKEVKNTFGPEKSELFDAVILGGEKPREFWRNAEKYPAANAYYSTKAETYPNIEIRNLWNGKKFQSILNDVARKYTDELGYNEYTGSQDFKDFTGTGSKAEKPKDHITKLDKAYGSDRPVPVSVGDPAEYYANLEEAKKIKKKTHKKIVNALNECFNKQFKN